MAYLTSTICQECGEEFMGDLYRGMDTCAVCLKLAADSKEATHFHRLDQMTIEQRLRELEKISYNRSKAKPVYVPPPVY